MKFKLKILQIEGFDSTLSFTCAIQINSSVHSVIHFPSNLTDTKDIEATPTDHLTINIQDTTSNKFLAHCVLTISTLKIGCYWVPLFDSGSTGMVTNLHENVQKPRILIDCGSLELAKNSEVMNENSVDAFESFVSELALFSLIESPAMDSQDLIIRPEFRFQCKKQEMIIKALYRQLELSKDRANRYFEKIRELEEKSEMYLKEISRLTKHSQDNEKSLLEIIDGKDKEIQEFMGKYSSASSRLRTLEFEKEHLIEKINQNQLELGRYEYIESELENALSKQQKSEEIQDKLNRLICKLSKEPQDIDCDTSFSTQLSLKDQEILMLKHINEELQHSSDMQITSLKLEIAELHHFLHTSQEQERYLVTKLQELNKNHIEKNSEGQGSGTNSECFSNEYQESTWADDLFYATMKKMNLLNESRKIQNFAYLVKGKIYNVFVGKDEIYVKNGKNFVSLEQSLLEPERSKSNIEERPKLLEERKSTDFVSKILDKRKSAEDEVKKIKKAASTQAFLKATKSSLNKIKNNVLKTPLREQKAKATERKGGSK